VIGLFWSKTNAIGQFHWN